MKSLHFASPLTAHGRCASQRYNEAHMFWHTNGKHFFFFFFPSFFFFFRGFFYFSGSATLNTRLLQALGEKGKVHWFSHTAGKRKVGALRVQRHLVPQHCWVSWPCHCLLWAAGDYVIIQLHWKKKNNNNNFKKPFISFGEKVTNLSPTDSKNPTGKRMGKRKQMVVFAMFSCIIAVFSPDCAYKSWLLPWCMSL